ncbi:restriction endonuclease subunit S [Methanococcus voltae]|uniref:restriction endonuclease subunit S n=1 Tax=Methanococcus voltae TaxID=2188 RepID=UPI001AE20A82|nr:restriction endonuclease subunit S [Methanococcus voltae]MBP2173284.1 type I restriction enzyme S subunit [Methanococcus voltae]
MIKEGYKETKIGILPEDWEVKKLGDVCYDGGKYGANAPAVPYNTKLPTYLRITDISDDGKIINEKLSSVDIPDYEDYILKKNDLVFARTGNTTGKTYLYAEKDGKLVYAGFLIKFSINPLLSEPKFIKFITETNYYSNWVKLMSQRSGQPGINSKEYGNLEVPLPPLKEQQKIAEILTKWDNHIETLENLISKKEEYKKGLMQNLLTGKVRFPGFNEEWKEVKLGEIVYEPKKNKLENPENYELLMVKLHCKGIEKTGKYPKPTKKGRPYYIRNFGELLIGRQNFHNGGIGIVTSNIKNCIASNAITSLLPHKNCNLNFLVYYISRFDYYKKAEYLMGGTGQKELSQTELLKLKIQLPPIEEQEKIAEVLTLQDKEIEILKEKLELLKLQKKGLMQKLLTGEIRVKC